MSRNDLFLLLACAVMAAILSGNPASLTRAPAPVIASLVAPGQEIAAADPTMFQLSFDHQ